jgi:hypothetical protein
MKVCILWLLAKAMVERPYKFFDRLLAHNKIPVWFAQRGLVFNYFAGCEIAIQPVHILVADTTPKTNPAIIKANAIVFPAVLPIK